MYQQSSSAEVKCSSSSDNVSAFAPSSSSPVTRSQSTVLDKCLPVLLGEQQAEAKEDEAPLPIDDRVHSLVNSWIGLAPVPPALFLQNILHARGYETDYLDALLPHHRNPSTKEQIADYSCELTSAIRNSDLNKLRELYQQGKNMTACNKFSESIVHMACRRSSLDIVTFLMQHGADFSIVDDYGRTPLHDACWRVDPCFEIVTLLLDKDLDLIRRRDKRGSIALEYVPEGFWAHWCAFLFSKVEIYWAFRSEPGKQNVCNSTFVVR